LGEEFVWARPGEAACMEAKRVSALTSILPSDASQDSKYTFVIDSHITKGWKPV